MQFRSPTDEPIKLISTAGGHSAIVGSYWRELPQNLHRLALAEGCECDQSRFKAVDVVPESSPEAVSKIVDYPGAYRAAIQVMLGRNEETDFTNAGPPDIRQVSKLCGFQARKEDVLQVWHAMVKEADAGAPGDGDPGDAPTGDNTAKTILE